jgi:hypothetical protein
LLKINKWFIDNDEDNDDDDDDDNDNDDDNDDDDNDNFAFKYYWSHLSVLQICHNTQTLHFCEAI